MVSSRIFSRVIILKQFLRWKFFASNTLSLGGNTIKVTRVESIMLGSNDERVFLRSFILFYITTVLCPSTYNFVNPKYLYSLRDKDILLVEHRDFGTLCLHNLFDEMENWKNKIFMNVGDYNRESWIGGCLPLLGVVYMDFVDFNGNAGTIDYSLPRMQYIKNADFKHLHRVDRNRKSRKAYGVLPIRDIAATPYGVPMLIPMPPQLPEPNDVLSEDDFDNDDSSSADEHESAEIIEVFSSADANGGTSQNPNSPEPEQSPRDDGGDDMHESPHFVDGYISPEPNDIRFAANGANIGTPVDGSMVKFQDPNIFADCHFDHVEGHATEETLFKGDGLFSIAMSYAEDPPSQETPIAEVFVNETPMNYNVLPNQGFVSSEQGSACEPFFAQSSFDKKNRKRHAAKTNSPDQCMSKLVTNPTVDAFYSKFMREKFYMQSESPVFIQIAGCPVRYDTFYSSFKARGNVADDVMCAQAQLFNEDSKLAESKKPFIKKHMFSSYTYVKLMKDACLFDKSSVVQEFSRIGREADIASLDLLHFPCVLSNHWVLVCANPLFGTMNFFDPTCMTSEIEQEAILINVATNLNSVFKELNLHCKDLEKFKISTPRNYPTHCLLDDCGLYVMLYAENYNGKIAKHFSNDIIPKYRMLKAYNMAYSSMNDIQVEKVEKSNKRRKL